RKDGKAALARFDRAIERSPTYASALIGRGEALVALNRDADAAAAFEAALAVDPSLADVRRRVDVLRFRAMERGLGAARQAARSGKPEDAVRAYQRAIAMSPDSGLLYRELAAVEQQSGDSTQALQHYRQAISLDPTDALAFERIAQLLEASGDLTG